VVTRHVVRPPECPDWSQPSTPNYGNAVSSNFGCSVRNNLAAQIANPRDLIQGQAYPGGTADGASKAIDAYRNRTLTGSENLPGTSTTGTGGAGGSQ